MKILPTLLITASLAGASVSHAADTPKIEVKATFGNTLFTIDPDGRSRKLWLRPDGTWTGLSRRGHDLAGKWRIDGDRICLSQSKPFLPGSLCQSWPADLKVGGPPVADPSGKSGQLKLVKGHVSE